MRNQKVYQSQLVKVMWAKAVRSKIYKLTEKQQQKNAHKSSLFDRTVSSFDHFPSHEYHYVNEVDDSGQGVEENTEVFVGQVAGGNERLKGCKSFVNDSDTSFL